MSEPVTGTIIVPPNAGGVPAKRATKTPWFEKGFFSMHNDLAVMDAAGQKLPTAMRLWFMCCARANRWNHAPFMPQEMRDLLGCSPNTMKSGLDSLKSARLVAPDSTPMCVVLAVEVYRRGDRANRTCIEVSHVDRQVNVWSQALGWEARQGAWDELMGMEPAQRSSIMEMEITRVTETIRFAAGSAA
jgi:hypothetical protein